MTTSPSVVRGGAFATALILALAGCASVPDVDEAIADAPRAGTPRVVGADGSLSAAQSTQVVSRVAGDGGESTLLSRHLAIEQAVAGTPLTVGNRTELLRDGDETFAAIFEAIHDAKHHVNLEYYTLEDVSSAGEQLSALLVAKRRAGVAVSVIYDSYGSSNTPREFFETLKAAGVDLVEFHPVNPLEAVAKGYSPNDRDHRKIMIVDGRIAVVGGVNLATYYQSKVPGSDASSEGATQTATAEAPDRWRDLALRIEGPAVGQLQGLFLGHWQSGGGDPLDRSGFFPPMVAKDGDAIRIIGSSPGRDASRYYVTLVSAIRSAEQRIWLTTAYFVPTFEEKEALIAAAERGVDVRLMLPANSDAPQAVAVARSHYYDLLESGVRIFEIGDVILHSKTVTIDGVWSAVGSSNFDHRSVLYNDEVDAIVLSEKTASGLEAVFEEDSAGAHEIKFDQWRERPMTDRLGDFFQRSLQFIL